MQHAASNACLDDNSAAACVHSILAPLKDAPITPELQATLVLLLAAACSKSPGRLPDTAVDLLMATAQSTAQGLQQQLQDMQGATAATVGGSARARPAKQAACSSLVHQADASSLQLVLLRAQSWAGKHLVTAGAGVFAAFASGLIIEHMLSAAAQGSMSCKSICGALCNLVLCFLCHLTTVAN
jgi:hypothetical protein